MVQIMFDRASSESGENECCDDDLFIKSRPASEELSSNSGLLRAVVPR
jgi:hypothetical protein